MILRDTEERIRAGKDKKIKLTTEKKLMEESANTSIYSYHIFYFPFVYESTSGKIFDCNKMVDLLIINNSGYLQIKMM